MPMMNNSMEMEDAMPTLPRAFRVCNQPNTFLWSVMLAFLTFLVALLLRKLRYKNFLGKRVHHSVVMCSWCACCDEGVHYSLNAKLLGQFLWFILNAVQNCTLYCLSLPH